MFKALESINERPEPFEFYTASDLWTDEHTSKQMLSFHLNEAIDVSSRNAEFIDRSVEWIAAMFNVGKGTKIADFGCGPGLYATRLARRGANVTGIDFSGRSIDYANEVAPREQLNINYLNQNYLEYETEDRFDLILMIMCDFCALSPKQRKGVLSKFNRILKPGGSVLLDVYSLTAFERREETTTYEVNQLNGFWSPHKYYGFVNTFKYNEEKVVLDKYTIAEAERIRTVYNWLQYFSPEELEKEFVESGFSVEGLYSDVAGTPYEQETNEFAVIAREHRLPKNTAKHTGGSGGLENSPKGGVNMNEEIRNALDKDRTIDIITIGAKTGLPRKIEIWFTNVNGRIIICGTPSAGGEKGSRTPRDWLANLRANPEFTFCLKETLFVELPARAVEIVDPEDRRGLMSAPATKWYRDQVDSIDELVNDSPIVEVFIEGMANDE